MNRNFKSDLRAIIENHLTDPIDQGSKDIDKLVKEVTSLIRINRIEYAEARALAEAHAILQRETFLMSHKEIASALDQPTDEVRKMLSADYDLTMTELGALVFVLTGKHIQIKVV